MSEPNNQIPHADSPMESAQPNPGPQLEASAQVTLKDVLALLPELFPGIQEVPLERIRSNPDNPGPPPTDEQVC